MRRFEWKLSYQNLVEFGFDGGRIEEFRPVSPFLFDHMQQQFNHNGDPFSFQRNVLDLRGGAIVRRNDYRGEPSRHWTPELWAEFVEYRAAKHAEEYAWCVAFRSKHGDSVCPLPVLELPRPIYWDLGENRCKTEPWYVAPQEATANAA